jgi:hypothetical protein
VTFELAWGIHDCAEAYYQVFMDKAAVQARQTVDATKAQTIWDNAESGYVWNVWEALDAFKYNLKWNLSNDQR